MMAAISEAIDSLPGGLEFLGGAGLCGFLLWWTITKSIPNIIKEFRDEIANERRNRDETRHNFTTTLEDRDRRFNTMLQEDRERFDRMLKELNEQRQREIDAARLHHEQALTMICAQFVQELDMLRPNGESPREQP